MKAPTNINGVVGIRDGLMDFRGWRSTQTVAATNARPASKAPPVIANSTIFCSEIMGLAFELTVACTVTMVRPNFKGLGPMFR